QITSFDGPTLGRPGETLHYTGVFSDPDPDTWTVTLNGQGVPAVSVNPDKTFEFDLPLPLFPSSINIHLPLTVMVADNRGGFDTRSIDLTIENVRPQLTLLDGPPSGLGFTGQNVVYSGVFTDTDADIWTGT